MVGPLDERGRKLLVVSAGVIIASAFLPWWTAGSSWGLGIDGDGPLTLVFGLAAITIATLREWTRRDRIAVGLLGVVTLAVSFVTYSDIGESFGGVDVAGSIGLHLTVVGGLGMIAAAVDREL